jgi:anaerobic ribonucleoside-triphosphate reductase activating protein
VCFLGGEWHHDLLLSHLQKAKGYGLKTCLYTGLPHCMLSQSILQQLDFLKTGSWHKKLGGLDNPHTNQKFIDLNTNTNLTHLFTRTQSC